GCATDIDVSSPKWKGLASNRAPEGPRMSDPSGSNSRDIWSHGSGTQLRDLISSSLATLLLFPKATRPVYFSSPWISDFVLLNNEFRQFSSLFPDLESRAGIRFAEYLAELAKLMPIRVMAVNNEVSRN